MRYELNNIVYVWMWVKTKKRIMEEVQETNAGIRWCKTFTLFAYL